MRKLHHVKSGLVILLAAIFILGIPSLPARQYHLLFWGLALLLEAGLIWTFWPLDQN